MAIAIIFGIEIAYLLQKIIGGLALFFLISTGYLPDQKIEEAEIAKPALTPAPPAVIEDEAEEAATQAEDEATEARVNTEDQEEALDEDVTLSLVRIERDGAAVIGGRARASRVLALNFSNEMIGQTTADPNGDFVFLVDLPVSERPEELFVLDVEGGMRSEPILVLGRQSGKKPTIVVARENSVEILQKSDKAPPPKDEPTPLSNEEDDATPENAAPSALLAETEDRVETPDLSLETISYADGGDVQLTGVGSKGRELRIYLNNEPVETGTVAGDGRWELRLPEINDGLYVLRVDEIDQGGQVKARVESPFKKDLSEMEPGAITVQPGATLWALANDRYGEGQRYVMIYEANRNQIRDPDLIYPGQVLTLPEVE